MELEPLVPAPTPPSPAQRVFFNERGLRAGWRLLIFLVICAVLQFSLFFLLSSVGKQPDPTALKALTAPFIILNDGVMFLLFLLASWIMSRIERRPLGVYGLPLKNERVLSRLAVGCIFWGFIPLSVCLFALHLLGGFDFGSPLLHGVEIWKWAAAWLLAFLLVGLAEEYSLRGYMLYTLADGVGFWPATIILAILFGFGHSRNPGETRVGLIATVVFAVFASITLRLTGSLWLAVGAHAGWDWGQSFFYGVSDSGLPAQGHFLNPTFHGPVWLTGGTVGPEGSVVTLILWSAMILIFCLIYSSRGRPVLATEAPSTAVLPHR